MVPVAEIQVRQFLPHTSAGPSVRQSKCIGSERKLSTGPGARANTGSVQHASANVPKINRIIRSPSADQTGAHFLPGAAARSMTKAPFTNLAASLDLGLGQPRWSTANCGHCCPILWQERVRRWISREVSPSCNGSIRAVPRSIGRGLVKLYRYTFSPLVGFHCRHLPTCSEYADQAIERFGLWAGGWMTAGAAAALSSLRDPGLDFVPEALPADSRWYMPWRYGRWRGTNAGPSRPRRAGRDAPWRLSKPLDLSGHAYLHS